MSIIIPTHRNAAKLWALLKSIETSVQSFEVAKNFQFNFEVLVVSNFEDPNVEQVCREFQNTKYLASQILGVNSARNLGLQNAKFEYFYFFDDDCRVIQSDFFQKLALEFVNLPSKKWFVGGPYQIVATANLFDRVYAEIQTQWLFSGILNTQNQCGYLLGGNFGGSTFEFKMHGFDPKIIFGGSETEMFLRLARIGYSCRFCPSLYVGHQTQLDSMDLMMKAIKQGRGAAYLASKGLRFESRFFVSNQLSLQSSSEIFWYNFYRSVFKLSYFLYLPLSLKMSAVKQQTLLLLSKPELLRKNLLSRLVAIIDVHLKTKK